MSRERWLEAEEKWPELQQFLACQFNQEAKPLRGSMEAPLNDGIRSRTLQQRQKVARQWWYWNQTAGATDDIRPLLNEGLGVDWIFSTPLEARKFMNAIYDTIVVSIRSETGKDWKP